MTAQQNPNVVTVKIGTGLSVLYIVLGALFLLLAIVQLLTGDVNIPIVLGPLFLAMGLLSLSRPYCTYDTASGALGLYSPLGFQVRSYGAPKGERIYFDPAQGKIMRALPGGQQKKVSVFGVNKSELARLVSVLPQHQA
ncbi:hypothetical protein [Glycomyces paridis]|uniref:Uncharacterized protein n=1 Tax=Glycomyces paridis TaxID=2126555 RepID=A0A4S8PEU3_9ACTN|nr:hypothetical protein [Glycomyces paridis]THV28381.1 hypothetical protein E9998_12295 [Glycomyces paridis]